MSKISVSYDTSDCTRTAVRILRTALSGPRSKELLSRPDISILHDEDINPRIYSDKVLQFKEDWLANNLLKKYPELDVSIDRDAAAMEKFWESEQICGDTNLRLMKSSSDMDVNAVISTARRKIDRLLGEFSWNVAAESFGFSSGASTRLKRRDALSPLKFSSNGERIHVTRKALPLAIAAVKSSPFWEEVCTKHRGTDPTNWFEVVLGNEILTVEKNAKTNRTIAKEPCMNMYLQRGIGAVMRRRLKKVGVNLDSQVKNQQLALEGSKDGSLATVDLSAASDTISCGVVELLLSPSWVDALHLTRSPWAKFSDDSRTCYKKISTMGNGYTFELESLIFWALTSSCVDYLNIADRRIAIYGDDIVVHGSVVNLLTRVFSYCGFSFNSEKSFVSGNFRESCGKHYFHGVDVTPFYIRKPINTISRLFWLVNSFRRWTSSSLGFSPEYYFKTWTKLITLIPKEHRSISVPDGMGDYGILRSLSDSNAKRRITGGYKIPALLPSARVREIPGYLAYLDTLSRMPVLKDTTALEDKDLPLLRNLMTKATSVVPIMSWFNHHRQEETLEMKNLRFSTRPAYVTGRNKGVRSQVAVGVIEIESGKEALKELTFADWTDPDPWIFIADDRTQFSFASTI